MSGALTVGLLLLWGSACLWLPSPAQGDLVIPGPDGAAKETRHPARTLQKRSTQNVMVDVYSVKVDCTVMSRFAHTVMTSTARNKAKVSQEIFFEMELPKTAFITNFTMEIDGRVYVGEVKEKEKAKKQYEKAISSGQTAGLVKASGRKMETFSVSVNIAAESNVTFVLTHEELLQRKLGQYEILTRVKPKELVQEFQIVANIYEPQGISYVDTHATFLSNDLLPLVEKTVTEKKAHIAFSPSLEQQRKCPGCDGTLIDGDFVIKYDVNRAMSLGDIQIVNGYFVHFFAPPNLSRVPTNVVFVIDRSGSMYGNKIRQTREAMQAILQDLKEDDYFSIILFDDQITCWKETMTKATKENLDEATKYIKNLRDGGGTNINDALLRGVAMLQKDKAEKRIPKKSIDMIILLTDGMPNYSETNPKKIQANMHAANGGNMTLFSLGFGSNVEYGFLNVLSQENKGLARRIFEASDAALQLKGFYEEISSPLLSEVNLRYPDNAVDLLTTNHFSQLFNGSEIVVAGRLMDNTLDNFPVEVVGQGFEEDFQLQSQTSALDWGAIYPDEEYIFGDFTERLWAYLTIQQLLDKSKTGSQEEKSNATARALDMSLQYSFVTPLTSMVVTKPETGDKPDSPLIADKMTEEERQHSERYSYHRHMSPIYLVDGDPHFIVELPDKDDAVCFNINDKPGTIFTLVEDSKSGILVNGQIIGDKQIPVDGQINTYFWRFGIIHKSLGVRLEVSTKSILVLEDGKRVSLQWSYTTSLKGDNMDILLTKDRSLTITLKDSVKFLILLHKVWKDHPYHRDYLGFYTLDTHLLSPSVHGLIGQFYHGIEYEVTNLRPGEVPEKPDATMYVKGQELNVTRGWQRDFRRDVTNGENVPCWFIHNNGTGLIDGDVSDYIVSGLFKTV
ncbi:inter-alpha-trypsin inhibitor heavy chain H3-like isoform X1 [Phyllopteryx taeniolatus]|uniref:inter-alpha-trypsin inhibitor heavy chain H3-like isoform X1 n=1 Tax=Phyllopteryx taeniolatus TaxID=161469 RepID=UPI002AD47276|nr:inter-alpha-trypsin inhibitor heavy chain H3-like isoform X1 [Phyllopteryx taeniolatus]